MNLDSDDSLISSDIAPNLPRTRGRVPGVSKRSLRKAERVKKPLRERPPLYTQPDEVLERIIPLASEVLQLVQLRAANGGTLPYGELKLAAQRLAPYRYLLLRLKSAEDDDAEEEEYDGDVEDAEAQLKPMHKNGVGYLMNHFVAYHATYKGRDPAEAFSPFQSKGRPPGRTLPTGISEFMKKLWKKRGFYSRNYDGTVAYVDYILFAKEIYNITKQTFPEKANIITLADVYHAREDVEKEDPAGLVYARQGLGALHADLPTQNSNIEGVHEQWQSDIRDLRIFCWYNGVLCTIRILYIVDRKSTAILAWKLIPGKDRNLKRLVVKRQFTAREFRDLFTWTVKHWGARPRQLYPDNGRQYAAEVLGPFMLYLTVPGEPPTRLPHTPPGDPRGRGLTENLLGDIDSFLRTRPAYYEKGTDGDFSYRAVLRRIDDGEVVPRTFEELAQDIKEHLDFVNSESEDGPTRLDLINRGESYGLSVPSNEQLFLFARRVESKKVTVQPYGIDYRKEQWEPERIDDPTVRAQWHQAALSSVQRQMVAASRGGQLLIYVNLAGDGINYEPFVKKGKPRLSEYAQKRANRSREGEVIAAHRTANEFVDGLLQERLGQPLTLDGSRKRAIPAPTDSVAQDDQSGTAPPDSGVADWARRGDRPDMLSGNEASQQPSDQSQPPPPNEEDDWNFFSGFAPKKS